MDKQTEELINKAALEGARQAIKEQKQQERAMEYKQKRKALHDTYLLLKNYNKFIKFKETATYIADELQEKFDEIEYSLDIEKEELSIRSILRSKKRTMTMILHTEKSLGFLKEDMELKQELYKYQVIELIFLQGKSIDEIIEERLIAGSKNSIIRWRNEMVDELAIYLYGYDGLKLDK